MMPLGAMAQGINPAEVLSAYATSSSKTSTSILSLLDGSGQGAWTPESKDFGTDEGLYIQFADPVPVNYIEVVLKGKFDTKAVGLDCYLDGKTGVSGGTKVEFWAVPQKNKAAAGEDKGLMFKIGQRMFLENGKSQDVPLQSDIRSFYFRITNSTRVRFGGCPTVTSIRFIGPKGLIPLKLPKIVSTQVKASSVLEPFTAYQPANLFDSRPDFAWSTNGKKTDGVGETVDLAFNEPQDLGGIVVWNGYQRSNTHYQANGRISQLEVSSDQGAPQTITIKDRMGPQNVLFATPLSSVRNLRLRILAIYPGSKYKDVLLSELRFLDQTRGLILPAAALVAPAAPPDYLAYLDKTWSSVLGSRMDTPDNSLRIRSNGSFVFYKVTGGDCDGFCPDMMISEGNWETSGNAFRIFGKKYALTYEDSVYLQNGKVSEEYGIFQSPLTLLPYKSLPLKKRLELLKKFHPETDVMENRNDLKLYWELSDMHPKSIWATTYDELLVKVDKHLLTIDALYAESNDLSDILAPNDGIDTSIEFE
jgi:hypothetical protein